MKFNQLKFVKKEKNDSLCVSFVKSFLDNCRNEGRSMKKHAFICRPIIFFFDFFASKMILKHIAADLYLIDLYILS